MQRLNIKLWFNLKKRLQLPTQFRFREQLEVEIRDQLWDQLISEKLLLKTQEEALDG